MDFLTILLLAISSTLAENEKENNEGINKIESRSSRPDLNSAQSIKRDALYTDVLDSLEIPDDPKDFSGPDVTPAPTYPSYPPYQTPSQDLLQYGPSLQTPSPDLYKHLAQYSLSPVIKTSFGFEPNPVVLRQEVPKWITKTITRDVHIPVLVPIPVEKHVPVTVEKHVPYPVKVPYAVPVDRPVPVQVPVEVTKNVPVYVERKVPYPVKVPVSVPVPYPVEKQVPVDRPVYIDRPVPQPVYVEKQVKVPYPVHVDRPVPVFYENKVPIPSVTPESQAILYQKMLDYLNQYYNSH